jgi:hypothetical protein
MTSDPAHRDAMEAPATGRDRIERLLKGWRLQHTADEDGLGYPLIDALSLTHADVSQGEDECFLIADAICGEILALLDTPSHAPWETAVEELLPRNSTPTTAPSPESVVRAALPDPEYLAFLFWKHEADRAAPLVAKNRTLQSFADQSPETIQIWMGFANVAIAAIIAKAQEGGE